MPNWIEGVLKVRGTKENIENFVRNGISYNDYRPNIVRNEDGSFKGVESIAIPRECEIKIDEDGVFVDNTMDLYINHSHRMFVNAKRIEGYFYDKDKEILCIDIRQAWGFNSNNFKEISKKFNVDLRVFGTEMGMEFCQLVEVVDGEIVKDQEITFDDFRWECPDPRIGG